MLAFILSSFANLTARVDAVDISRVDAQAILDGIMNDVIEAVNECTYYADVSWMHQLIVALDIEIAQHISRARSMIDDLFEEVEYEHLYPEVFRRDYKDCRPSPMHSTHHVACSRDIRQGRKVKHTNTATWGRGRSPYGTPTFSHVPGVDTRVNRESRKAYYSKRRAARQAEWAAEEAAYQAKWGPVKLITRTHHNS
jgi:hypothetical protein